MKRTFTALCACVFATLMLSCASTKKGDVVAGSAAYKQALADGFSEEAAHWVKRGAWTGKFEGEKGVFGTGYAAYANEQNSLRAARLHARRELAEYLGTQMVTYSNETSNDDASNAAQQIKGGDTGLANKLLVGSMQIDSYKHKNGEIHVLMFISEENLKAGFEDAGLKQIGYEILARLAETNEDEL